MKQLTRLAATIATGIALSAAAVPTLTITDGSGINLVVPAGANGFAGGFTGDAFWRVVIATAVTSPAIGQPTAPSMDVSIQAFSVGSEVAQAPTLTISWSATDFGPYNGALAARLSGHTALGTGQDVTFNTYYDAGNGLNVLGTALTSSGTLNDPPNYNSSLVGNLNQNLFSMTEVFTIAPSPIGSRAFYSLDGSIGPVTVPDGGRTATLLAGALLSLVLVRRRFSLSACWAECERLGAKGLKVMLAIVALAGLTNRANAAASLTLYDSINPLITVTDNGPGDADPDTGSFFVSTNVGVWYFINVIATTKPTAGSATDVAMAVNIQAYSSAAGTLYVTFSDNGFGPDRGTVVARVDGHIVSAGQGTVTYDLSGDPDNVVGATTVPLTSIGPTAFPASATASGPLSLGAPYSLTQVIQINANSAGGYDVEASFDPPIVTPVSPDSIKLTSYSGPVGPKLELHYNTSADHHYVLESCPVVGGSGQWSVILTNAGTGGVITNVVTVDPSKGQQYFRYKVQ